MKNNKISTEEQDTGKLGKLCSAKKASRRKWLATWLSDTSALPTMLKHNWDRDINDFATKSKVLVALNASQCS